jgi:cytochrome c553
MKLVRLKLAILAFVCSGVPSLAGELETAVRNCGWCHGMLGQGVSVAPQLAGQRSQYIISQLMDFRERTRDNPHSKQYMWGPAANLNPQVGHELAAYFASLPPKAAGDGSRELVDAGREIYLEGVQEANIVACAACHGPNAEGVRDIPRLGGLAYHYLKRRLDQWGEGYHAAARAPMPRIAGKLSHHAIEALASYLSFVK